MSASRAGRALRVAVIGAGWAGLAAAVRAVQQGHQVTIFEMARQAGGRARSTPGSSLDNGQHILIGAYRDTLDLMRTVGVEPEQALLRCRLTLRHADGRGLAMPAGPAAPAFAWAVLRARGWTWGERLQLLAACGRWAAAGFDCRPDRSVAELCAELPPEVRRLLIDPLCVAALNTPSQEASAAIFLRVLRDGLFGGRGACDLLLPRQPLRELLPEPALRWLQKQGATWRPGVRMMALQPGAAGWRVDAEAFDAVLLACSAAESARLAHPHAPDWAATAEALRFEPIITVYVRNARARLPSPMLVLPDNERAPAQFVFDHGAIGCQQNRFAFVISDASRWVEAGLAVTAQAVLRQAAQTLGPVNWPAGAARIEHVVAERRATFRSTPGLLRPPMHIAPGLFAAGDHVDGPYPATLEGAVQSGSAAARALRGD